MVEKGESVEWSWSDAPIVLPVAFDSREWNVANLQIPETEWPKFDWRSRKDCNVSEEEVLEPLRVAQTFLNDRLGARLDRITKQQSS